MIRPRDDAAFSRKPRANHIVVRGRHRPARSRGMASRASPHVAAPPRGPVQKVRLEGPDSQRITAASAQQHTSIVLEYRTGAKRCASALNILFADRRPTSRAATPTSSRLWAQSGRASTGRGLAASRSGSAQCVPVPRRGGWPRTRERERERTREKTLGAGFATFKPSRRRYDDARAVLVFPRVFFERGSALSRVGVVVQPGRERFLSPKPAPNVPYLDVRVSLLTRVSSLEFPVSDLDDGKCPGKPRTVRIV